MSDIDTYNIAGETKLLAASKAKLARDLKWGRPRACGTTRDENTLALVKKKKTFQSGCVAVCSSYHIHAGRRKMAASRIFDVATTTTSDFHSSFLPRSGLVQEAFCPKRVVLWIDKASRCLQIKAVLSNQKAPNDNSNEKSTSERTRAALERLFAQSQRFEQGSDLASGKNKSFDLDIACVKTYVDEAVEALHMKEEELRAAENSVKADEENLKCARSALLEREKQLEAASHTHNRIKEELISAKQRSIEQAKELDNLKHVLSQREREVTMQQEGLSHKVDELGVIKREMLQKEASLADALRELEARASRLTQSRDFISKQASQLGELRNALGEQEKSLASAEKEKRLQQQRLSKAEAELEQRTLTWLRAQEQLKALKQDLTYNKSSKELTEKELRKCEALLSQVRTELDSSQKEIQNSRNKVKVQEMENRKQKDDISHYKVLLSSLEKELSETQRKLNAEKERHNLVQTAYNKLKEEWNEGQQQALTMKEKLEEQKRELHISLEEVHRLRVDLQQKDSGLSDTQLLLQLREAELVSAKMELRQVNSDFNLNQLLLKDKGLELENAQENLQLLQNEVFQLSTTLQAKESQLTKVLSQLNEKENQLNSMMVTLDHRTVRLSEVTFAIEQMASLSHTLANAASPGIAAAQKEETQLMQANYQLFASRRENLEKDLQIVHLKKKLESVMQELRAEEAELEALKDGLRLKNVELLEARRDLSNKDEALNKLMRNWDVREEELKTLRKEVMDEANGLITLHTLAQSQGTSANISPADVAIENLQLEAAKLNEEAALCALQSLAELGEELVLADKEMTVASNEQELVVENSTCEQLSTEAFRARLIERESALEATRNAVENLLKLTMSLTDNTQNVPVKSV
ncbi:hypothetical protein L7F22_032132 [Adiantum nelumboides]|nr:hypothetical protein [Adiantum nelumboides]